MTDEADDTDDDPVVSLEPGTQAVAMVSAMDDPLRFLPKEAFKSLLIVSTRCDPPGIEKKVREAGADPSNVLVVPVSGTSLRYDGPLRLAERTAPSDMTKVGVKFMNGLQELGEGSEPWAVIDNFNVFLMYSNEKTVYRFMNSLTREARSAEARGLYCTVRDAVGDRTYEKFRQLCDVELDLR
ncbi:MAG: hypothetical protein U5J64_11895 [Halobacteriales archaeon]|nr:hypothetical protein [Halobacteriales archaeon]